MPVLPTSLCHPARVALLPDRLTAGSVELHRWDPSQAGAVYDAVVSSLGELRPWMPWAADEPTEERMRAVLGAGRTSFDQDREWTYVVTEPGDERVLGAVGLHRRDEPGTLEIGYWIRTDATGKGLATAAARSLTTAAFTHLDDTDVVEIRMDTANLASAAVPPRLGFRLDREVARPVEAPGQCGRGHVWVMTRDRWEAAAR